MSLPVEVADLTPSMVSELLRATDPSVAVVGSDVLDAQSETTGRARLALQYGGPMWLPATMFVKLDPFDVRQRAFVRAGGIGANEARLYRDAADELPMRIPKIWSAAIDGSGGCVAVMEDLNASGCRFPRPSDANSLPTEVRRALEDELHGRYLAILHRAGVGLAREDAWGQYRLFAVYSAVSTVSVGSRWQPAAPAMAAMDRTTTAIEDLDAAGCPAARMEDT